MDSLKHDAADQPAVRCAIVTVSDTRTEATDGSGAIIRKLLSQSGHRVCGYEILPDEPDRVRDAVTRLCHRPDCQAVLVNGGTGIAPRDSTVDALSTVFEKRLDGFGELFRMLSFEQIGPTAMLSRATAGVVAETIVFVMPGSPPAVQLAMDKLIVPCLAHMAGLLRHGERRE